MQSVGGKSHIARNVLKCWVKEDCGLGGAVRPRAGVAANGTGFFTILPNTFQRFQSSSSL